MFKKQKYIKVNMSIVTSTSFPLEMKKWPEITILRTRKPDSSFDSKTF